MFFIEKTNTLYSQNKTFNHCLGILGIFLYAKIYSFLSDESIILTFHGEFMPKSIFGRQSIQKQNRHNSQRLKSIEALFFVSAIDIFCSSGISPPLIRFSTICYGFSRL